MINTSNAFIHKIDFLKLFNLTLPLQSILWFWEVSIQKYDFNDALKMIF